jgi:hypothetical protein
MPIKQLFINEEIKQLSFNGEFISTGCASIEKDSINWQDAEQYVQDYQEFLKNNQMGKALSFALTQGSINVLLGQDSSLDAVKIYLAYSKVDKTIRAFVVASKLNTATSEFDDFHIPANSTGIDYNTMPKLENMRPCPHQCGVTNMLNRDMYP